MRLRWIAVPAVVASILVMIPFDGEEVVPNDDRIQPGTSLSTDVTVPVVTTLPPAPSTTTFPYNPVGGLELLLETLPAPTYPEIACATANQLGSNKYLDRALKFCLPIAQAYLDLIEGRHGIAAQLDRLPPAPGDDDFVLEFFTLDVVHMLYVMSGESFANPLANGQNWGCPRQPAIAALHPDPEGIGPVTGRSNCLYQQNRVPVGWMSHMSHTLEGRSDRILGWLIDPYDLYESALLGYGLVFETGGNGWYHWWHIHWNLNRYLTPLGIQGVYHCPPGPYWQNVKGGRQDCPYD